MIQLLTHFRWSSVVGNLESAKVSAIKFLHNFYIYLIYIFCIFVGFSWPIRYAAHVTKFAIFNNTVLPKKAWLMTSQWRHILSPSSSHLAYATFVTIFYNIGASQSSRHAQSLTIRFTDFVKFSNIFRKNTKRKVRFSRWRNEIIEISGSAFESSNDCLSGWMLSNLS